MARNLAGLTEIANELNLACSQRFGTGARFLPALILMTDHIRLPDPGPSMRALPPGSAVIFRHYDDPLKEETAKRLRHIARDHKLVFLVAGDADLAVRLAADGCHLPEHMVHLAASLKAQHPEMVITATAHSATALAAAEEAQVDAVLLSPVFATESHPGAETLGVASLRHMTAGTSLPIYALGGITHETAPLLVNSGIAGLAAIGALTK